MSIPSLPNLPAFLADETEAAIRDRLLKPLQDLGIDVSEGSMAWNQMSPIALELVQLRGQMRDFARRPFARYTFGAYLDHIAEQRAGIVRKAAVKARTTLRFTGTTGKPIPAGSQVSTQLQPGATGAAIVFATLADATVGVSGTVDVLSECTVAGATGNVGAGALKVLVTSLQGISSVTNLYEVGSGTGDVLGTDTEDDTSLALRYLDAVQNPPGSGSMQDYIRWAKAVSGVGGVFVAGADDPLGYGANTVRIVLTGTDAKPASSAVVAAVEDTLFAPRRLTVEAETLTLSGFGATVDSSKPGASGGSSVKLLYSASGTGLASGRLDLIPLPQAGTWTLFPTVEVDSTAGTNDLLQIGVYNVTLGAWAKTTRSGAVDAVTTWKAQDLATMWTEMAGEDFYWNGSDQVELRITRLQTDTTTTVWVDTVRYRSAFQSEVSDCVAPACDRVYVEPAKAVTINISYHPVYAPGAVPATVDAAVDAGLATYISSLALQSDNDVRYVRVGGVILDAAGMLDYTNLTVNGGTTNVAIAADQVAVLGTITRT